MLAPEQSYLEKWKTVGGTYLDVLQVRERADTEVGHILAQNAAAKLVAACQG